MGFNSLLAVAACANVAVGARHTPFEAVMVGPGFGFLDLVNTTLNAAGPLGSASMGAVDRTADRSRREDRLW